MGKRYKVLCLNGHNKGKEIEVDAPYTQEQEDEARRKKKFAIGGIEYDGWCRKCNHPVRHDDSITYVNVDGIGNIIVDVFHKGCD